MKLRAFASLAALLVLPIALPLGCVEAPQHSAEAAKAEQAAEAQPEAKAPADPNELSAEELELIAADPKDLSPEKRRQRAYAMRKKIMQNPDSASAQALEEARAAALNGELTPEQVDPEGKPEGKKDPGLVIELPEHLQDPRVSKAEPAQPAQ